MKKARWLSSVIAFSALLAAPIASAGGWEKVTEENGIVVHKKDVPGRDMPTFRGRTTMQASPTQILAVLQDLDRHCEWRPKCANVSLLEQVGPTERYYYTRSSAPWPASDRDVVLHSSFDVVVPGKHIETSFKASSHAKKPEKKGIVRIKRLKGHYKLVAIDGGRTKVEYQVDTDPGGSVPTWLAARESKDVPLDTLRNLRKQVNKRKGKYASFVSKWERGS